MHGVLCDGSLPVAAITHGNPAANGNSDLKEEKMNGQDEKQNQSEKGHEGNRTCTPRDWERSEWFRRWLELIRPKTPQAAS